MKGKQDWLVGLTFLFIVCIFIYLTFFTGVNKFKSDVIGKAVEGACGENWICGNWSGCEDNLQLRECIDLNNCLTELKKPDESAGCSIAGVKKSGMSIRADFEKRTGISLGGVVLFGALVLVLSSLAAILISTEVSKRQLERDKDNTDDLSLKRLANYIQRELNCGYTKNQIMERLVSEGWNKKSIDDAFSKVKMEKKPSEVLLENNWKMDLSKKIEDEFKSYGK